MRLLYTFLAFGTITTLSYFSYENIPKERRCIECDQVSKDLQKIGDSVAMANQHSVKKTVNNVLVLDSARSQLKNSLDSTKKELKAVKTELKSVRNELTVKDQELKQKPKEIIIRDTVRIVEKKNFWGKTKKDTL